MALNKAKGKEQLTVATNKTSLCPMPYALCLGHGGNIYRIAEELGLSEDKLLDFSASINPLGISKKVKDVIKRELNALINYPDPDAKMLRKKLAEHHGIGPDSIICGNGSTELIYLIPRALKPESVLIPSPTFSEYERACKTASYELKVMSCELKEENSFGIIPDEFVSAIKTLAFNSQLSTLNSQLVFLCNPNNPTGHLLKKDDVLRIAEAARDTQCVLVVDEAFIDFHPQESVINHVQDNPYLIVLRSMTKFYALTGLRIGYGVFHPDLISRIKDCKEPWTVNNLAQKAAITALEDMDYIERTYRLIAREKRYMEKSLEKCGISFFPSAANYYLLKVADAGELVARLRNKGILIRDCSNFRALNNSYIRIAVKSRKHNEILIKELEDIWRVIPAKAGIQEKETGFRLKDCRNDRGTP